MLLLVLLVLLLLVLLVLLLLRGERRWVVERGLVF
jgi:hypothetical protein